VFAKRFPGSKEVADAVATATNTQWVNEKPRTTSERMAQTVGEFIPTATVGVRGSVNANPLKRIGADAAVRPAAATVGNAVIPGSVVGYAEQRAEEGKVPAWVAPVAGVVSTLASHQAGNWLSRGDNAARLVSNAISTHTPEHLAAAEQLFQQSRVMGVPLTRAEALSQVSGGMSRLSDLQRVVEGQGGLRDYLSQRPAQVETAVTKMLSDLSPAASNPSNIGPAVGRAADSVVSDVTRDVNEISAPLYRKSEAALVSPADTRRLSNDALVKQTLDEIRNSPALNRTITHLPDNSIGVLDKVQQRMGESATNLRVPGQATTSNAAAAGYDDARKLVRDIADTTSPTYVAARELNAQLRREYLEPLMSGPIGRLAQSGDLTTKNAITALFPDNPLAGSADEITHAVKNLVFKNKSAARQLVRAHVEGVFNSAAKDLQSGANEFGGANFRAKLVGNKQQAENLAAAIRALPDGNEVLAGFNKLMDIMEATGQRQRVGSLTAFNAQALDEMRGGNAARTGVGLALGGLTKLPARIMDKLDNWNIGQNVDDIARLLTDPQATSVWRALGKTKDVNATTGRLLQLIAVSKKR
jgi:hypothetical protein